MEEYTNDYLLDKQIKIFQPVNGYRASSDAVLLSSAVQKVKSADKIIFSLLVRSFHVTVEESDFNLFIFINVFLF